MRSKSGFAKKSEVSYFLSSDSRADYEKDITQISSQISSSTAQSTNVQRARKYLNLGLKEHYIPTILKYFVISVWVFFIGVIGFTIYEYFHMENMASLAESNIEIVGYAQLRMDYLVESTRRCRLLKMVKEGLIDEERHIITNVLVYSQYNLDRILIESNQLANYTQIIRSNIHQIDRKFIDVFYQKDVTITQDDQTIERYNSFNASIKLASTGIALGQESNSLVLSNNSKLSFILQNSLNDLLIKTNQAKDIILQGTEHANSNSLKLSIVVMVVMPLYSFLVVQGLLIGFIMRYKADTKKMFEHLSRFSGKDEIIVERLEGFKSLAKVIIDEENLHKIQQNWSKVKTKAKGTSKFDKKMMDTKGLFISIAKQWIVGSMVMLIFIICYILINLRVAQFKSKYSKIAAKYTYALEEMNTLSLALTAFYEFVHADGATTIQNMPSGQALDTALERLQNVESLYSAYSGAEHDFELDPAYTTIFQGYLCDFALPIYHIFCVEDLEYNSKGLFGLKSFYSLVLRKLKRFYASSNHTTEDKKEVLNDFDLILAERRLYFYTRPAYQELERRLDQEMFDYFNNFKHQSLLFCLGFNAILIILFFAFWRPFMIRYSKRYDKLKALLRLIPIEVLGKNKGLISFLKAISPRTIGTKTIDLTA